MPDKQIVFAWNKRTYTIPFDQYPILLPNGEVLVGNGWLESNPPQPRDLQLLYPIKLDGTMSLPILAERLDAILATEVTIVEEYICPHNCPDPGPKFCQVCGSPVQPVEVIYPKIPPPAQ